MKFAAGILFFLVTIAVYGILAPLVPRGVPMLFAYPLVLLLSFASTFVHELGHAAMARFLGADIRKIVVVPFEYRPDKRRLGWAKKLGNAEIGGFVAYSLDRIEARRKHMLIALAGPLANFALAGLILAGIALVDTGGGIGAASGTLPGDRSVTRWAISLQPSRIEVLSKALAMLSIGAGLVNLIPFRGSDGQAIFRALRSRSGQSR